MVTGALLVDAEPPASGTAAPPHAASAPPATPVTRPLRTRRRVPLWSATLLHGRTPRARRLVRSASMPWFLLALMCWHRPRRSRVPQLAACSFHISAAVAPPTVRIRAHRALGWAMRGSRPTYGYAPPPLPFLRV